MVYNNRVQPLTATFIDSAGGHDAPPSLAGSSRPQESARTFSKEANDLDSLSTVGLEESTYLKLKPFTKLDPTLTRLLKFLNCFGLTVNFVQSKSDDKNSSESSVSINKYSKYLKIFLVVLVCGASGEVVYDVNLRQSKLLAEQKRSTPLLTFAILFYSWLTVVVPVICDISLILIGSHLFRFYSRTTATVCNGMFFGKKTTVDSWYYYFLLVLIAFLDATGQVVALGVWPESIDPYMKMIQVNNGAASASSFLLGTNGTMTAVSTTESNETSHHDKVGRAEEPQTGSRPKVTAYVLDHILGETHAHSDLGVCIKILCLMIQFFHSYAFFIIIISLAKHYATAINNINLNLDKYEFRRLLKQLIILRDSSEQISLIISIPFALIIVLAFMRQIALNGVFIQSTMLPFENWAVSLQSFTCSVSIFMVFFYCDGLQSASKQTHRLKTEQTVINENRGGNQSIYEFLDYLDRLSKSIRITFFNIISINKSSLVGLYGHILTLTFVTS